MEERYYITRTGRKKLALNAVIGEIKNYINEHNENKVDINKLFENAYNNVVQKIIQKYEKGAYDRIFCDDLFDQRIHERIKTFAICQKELDNYYERVMNLKKTLESAPHLYSQSKKNEVDSLINEISGEKERLKKERKPIEKTLYYYLKSIVPIIDCVFEKGDKNNLVVQEWIKAYADNISFSTLSISNQILENANFEGIKGIRINVDEIANNSLANAKLSGVIFTNKSGGPYTIIDPSKININGADFTGSKGAVIMLDNIEKIPGRRNFKDAKIAVKSIEDIQKHRIKKYLKNVFYYQKSIANGEVINIDFNDYLYYTGTINKNEYKDIKESLIMVCDDKEYIRNEMNKIVAYDIASRFIELFNFQKLFDYFWLISTINSDNLEKESIQSNQSKEEIQNNVQEVLAAAYKEVGNVILDPTKIVDADGKVKIYTKNGVLTLDIFKLGVTKEEYERMKKGYYVPEPYRQFLEKGLEKISEYTAEKTSNQKTGDESITAWIDSIDSSQTLRTELTNIIQSVIYNSLEKNNLGYSFDLKKAKKKR